jgi:hypothetical protein
MNISKCVYILFFSTVFNFLSINLQAIEEDSTRFTFGPILSYRSYSEDLIAPHKSDEFGPFIGVNLGVEKFKKNNVYWGLEGRYSIGRVTYDGATTNLDTNFTSPYQDTSLSNILNIEGRLGYTLRVDKKLMYTPFIGLGYHSWYRGEVEHVSNDYSEVYRWNYVALGVKANQLLSESLELGLNLKAMLMFNAEMELSLVPVPFYLGKKVHFEIEVPITYHLDVAFNEPNFYTIQITPFYRNQNIGESDPIFARYKGSTISLIEPSSTTHVFGAKVEFVQDF